MKDRKIRIKDSAELWIMPDDTDKPIDLMEREMLPKLQTLDGIFAENKDHPEEFHQLYLKPLLESGVSLEDSFTLLVEGVLRPN